MNSKNFAKFCATIAELRHPARGCPWDLQQTHKTLRKYMIEEAYEAAQVMSKKNDAELCDELGDVLLQVVLNAQIAKDRGSFTIDDVIKSIDSKMIRRHPHVFEAQRFSKKQSIKEVWNNWEKLKVSELKKSKKSVLENKMKKASKQAPSSRMAAEIGKVTAQVKFDWQNPREVFKQLESEMTELKVELTKPKTSRGKISEEIGDVFFSLVQLTRHLKLDAETVFIESNQKFLKRFDGMLKICKKEKRDFESYDLKEKELLWKRVKNGKLNLGL